MVFKYIHISACMYTDTHAGLNVDTHVFIQYKPIYQS